MQLVAGIQSCGLPKRFANAQHRIILHAAIYGPFSASEDHRNGLEQALGRSSFERMDIIALTADSRQPWKAQFLDALRHNETEEAHAQALQDSDAFLDELKQAHGQKTFIHPLTTFPCQPIVIVDNTILFGQYAHCTTYAANGFWGMVETDVDKLFGWAKDGQIPPAANDDEIAAYRMVSDCHHAMNRRISS